jgi:hypothetical protein
VKRERGVQEDKRREEEHAAGIAYVYVYMQQGTRNETTVQKPNQTKC